MAVAGIPTNSGVGILSGTLREEVKKFCLYGTNGSSDEINFNESSTLASMSGYLVGEFDISRAYFDDNGTLTFECPLPYDFSNTKWVAACGLVHVDGNGTKTLVAVSSMPRFQKTSGIGGTVHYKVPIAGESSSIIFEDMPYVTRQELDVVFNEQHSAVAIALDLAAMANREHTKTLQQRMQTGETVIYNRGIKNGCVLSKSTTATRNVTLASGTAFIHGKLTAVPELVNTANVPQNTTDAAKVCTAYLWIDENGNVQVDCTDFSQAVPEEGMPLYTISVPAYSTEASDPHLDGCTLADIRLIEPNYPTVLINAPFTYVPLEFDLIKTDYTVNLDVLSFEGGGFQMGYVYTGSRAKNGFSIYTNGTADTVRVRWSIVKTNL